MKYINSTYCLMIVDYNEDTRNRGFCALEPQLYADFDYLSVVIQKYIEEYESNYNDVIINTASQIEHLTGIVMNAADLDDQKKWDELERYLYNNYNIIIRLLNRRSGHARKIIVTRISE